jgi:hypothetical protein
LAPVVQKEGIAMSQPILHLTILSTRRSTAIRLGLLAWLLAGPGPASAADPIRYNRQVRPILSENCFACHGPDSAARKADLRLDQRENAIDLGAIVPGDPENSELVVRIDETDKTLTMPPPSSHKNLTAAQKDILRRWIAEGAEYEPHWSFIPPQRVTPPPVKNESWIGNPIDHFVLAQLEARGLSPAPEADRRTLARRLSLDLTGLPPAPELVEGFVRDIAPDAYERLVDRLMSTPQWGEHRARYWLDAARYADTHGIHFDNYREMWSYREWVVDAFNRNQPFDQFTIDQLAGDLLPNPTLAQRIASGFNRCNMTTNEGGTIPEEYLVLYTRDRTETVSQVWLGLTANCATCHDHKFDPLTQREFYEMAAFFNNTTQAAMDGNIKDTPPVMVVPADQDRDRWESLVAELSATRKRIEERKSSARNEFDAWLKAATPASVATLAPSEGLRLRVALGDRFATTPTLPGAFEVADSGNFANDQPFSVGAWVRPAKNGLTGAIASRMADRDDDFRGWDLSLDRGRVATHLIHRWPNDAIKVFATSPLKAEQWSHVLVTYDGSGKAGGVKIYVNGELQSTRTANDTLTGSILTDVPLKVGQRFTSSRLENASLSDLRVYDRALPPQLIAQLQAASFAQALIERPETERPTAELDALYTAWLTALDPATREVRDRLAALEVEEAAIKSRGTIAHVMQEKPEEAMAYILYRGEYDKRRDPVKPDTPDILPPMPDDLPRNRLGFARWLLREDQPLTARVTVNRFWQEIFGQGLVRTSGDLGVSGELPSDPELLDWLAVEFRESGWDVKRFFKLLVTSATYRQSAVVTPEKLERDPQNQWLSRGPRFRMDAEMVRDYALQVSGLLVGKLGGPSVKPYQPEGVWEAVAMPESNTRFYKPDTGDGLYRRSLYTFWKRAAPPASMEIFNAPNRETCTVRRERTNTPLQALVTLNDPQFVEAARILAQKALQRGEASTDQRCDFLARRLLSRPFRSEELTVVSQSLDNLLSYYREHPQDAQELLRVGEAPLDQAIDPSTLAAWTMLCNQLMNLDEVLNK